MRCSHFLIFLVAFAPTLQMEFSDEQVEQFKQFNGKCLNESQVDLAKVLHSTRGRPEDDPKLKEFFFCMNKEIGLQDKKGNLQKDAIRNMMRSLGGDMIDAVIKQCAENKESPQETAYHFLECSRKVVMTAK